MGVLGLGVASGVLSGRTPHGVDGRDLVIQSYQGVCRGNVSEALSTYK